MSMTLDQIKAEIDSLMAQKEAAEKAQPASPLKDILAHLDFHGNANVIEIREALRMLLVNLIEKEPQPVESSTAKQKAVKAGGA